MANVSDYELVSQTIGASCVYVLKLIKKSDTFLDELLLSSKTKAKAITLIRQLERIAMTGVDWGFESKALKPLKGCKDIALCEVRVKGKVYRIMAYLHYSVKKIPILLFYFEGHRRRAAGGIPDQVIKRGRELGYIAKALAEKENWESL